MKYFRKLLSLAAFAAVVSAFGGCSDRTVCMKPPMMGWSSWNAYMVDI